MQETKQHQIERDILELIAALSKRDPAAIKPADALVDDLGIDSIQFLELLAMLEETFGLEVEADELRPELFRSVRSVTQFVKGKIEP